MTADSGCRRRGRGGVVLAVAVLVVGSWLLSRDADRAGAEIWRDGGAAVAVHVGGPRSHPADVTSAAVDEPVTGGFDAASSGALPAAIGVVRRLLLLRARRAAAERLTTDGVEDPAADTDPRSAARPGMTHLPTRQDTAMHGPQTDPYSEVPWGRPPLPDLPVPPFESRDQHVRFLECLAIHVAASGSSPMELTDMVLLTLLDDERKAVRWTGANFPRELSPLAVRIAVRTFFPAPWTPRSLAEAMRAVGQGSREQMWRGDRGVSWGDDPTFFAKRRDDGSWEVVRNERGSATTYADLADDDELVLLMLGHQRTHAFPLGWGTDGVPVERVIESASRGVESWSRHRELPYITSWTETVDRVRRGGVGGS